MQSHALHAERLTDRCQVLVFALDETAMHFIHHIEIARCECKFQRAAMLDVV